MIAPNVPRHSTEVRVIRKLVDQTRSGALVWTLMPETGFKTTSRTYVALHGAWRIAVFVLRLTGASTDTGALKSISISPAAGAGVCLVPETGIERELIEAIEVMKPQPAQEPTEADLQAFFAQVLDDGA